MSRLPFGLNTTTASQVTGMIYFIISSKWYLYGVKLSTDYFVAVLISRLRCHGSPNSFVAMISCTNTFSWKSREFSFFSYKLNSKTKFN